MSPGSKQNNDLLNIVFRSLGLGLQISAVVVAAVLGGLFSGLWVDRRLGTSPWATLLMVVLGTFVAVVGVYRLLSPLVAKVAEGQEMEWGESLRSLLVVARIGFAVITPVLIGFFLGLWLDGRLDTTPWLSLALAVLGAVGGLAGAWSLSSVFSKRMAEGDQEVSD
ncbi:MAG: AtpZ/AtpI family protein [Anaerolineae bacterium]|jgi:F0F1-type ATP synthase assembly protein I